MATALPFFAPEVIQTSAMDCGPAALKCLLAGFGIVVSYGRLREACQTDVDGTSIDALEDVANQLGLAARQLMLPVDHLLLPSAAALPALVVATLPNGNTHFVVVWRTLGSYVQIMDPGTGRRWLPQQRFLNEIYRHEQTLPASNWRAWAGSPGFLAPLRQRLDPLGISTTTVARLLTEATDDPAWRSLAALDASTRLLTTLTQSRSMQRGAEAERLLIQFFEQGRQATADADEMLPTAFWSVKARVTAQQENEQAEEEQVVMRGAVMLSIHEQQVGSATAESFSTDAADTFAIHNSQFASAFVTALRTQAERPEWEIWRMLRLDGLLTPTLLIVALAMAALGTSFEVFLLRGLLETVNTLQAQPAGATQIPALMGLLLALALILLLAEAGMAATLLRLGRRLETRLRIRLLAKIAQLSDRYFHSRLTSDMTQRAHELRGVRTIPSLAASFLRTNFQLLFTVAGIALLSPASLPLALLTLLLVLAITLLTQPHLSERDMRVRSHNSALSRFYLDALLGLLPLRTHGAERAFRREQEGLLVDWVQALASFYQSARLIQFASALVSIAATIAIVFGYVAKGGEASGVILLLYWALNLPALAQSLTDLARQYPVQRNRILRLLEPLDAPGEDQAMGQWGDGAIGQKSAAPSHSPHLPTSPPPHSSPTGVAIALSNVTVHAGGHTILQAIDLVIAAGEHVAIVGESGAGKSSLVGLLLGWHRAVVDTVMEAVAGEIWVDGVPLRGAQLAALRRATAWVDPAVQIWNRALLENLHYGTTGVDPQTVQQAMAAADLFRLLESLPNGLQTRLGEGGGLVSGGEGQRVRLGRALLRPAVRLAILDEPFRGLDRRRRQQLLRSARQHWQPATLLCITHDVGETLDFPRVLVIDKGRIVEDGAPAQLAADLNSRYRRLLDAETVVRSGLWQGAIWRRLWMENGRLESKN